MIVDPATAPVSGEKGLRTLHLSVAGGIRQFGAYLDTLDPGAWSSHRHWHSAEDEFLLMLSGRATLRDDTGMTDLHPGDAVAWRHGDPNGHHLTNRGGEPARWLIVGSRCRGDICTYPDDGRRQINGEATWRIEAADGGVLKSGELPAELRDLSLPWGKPFDGTPRPNVLRNLHQQLSGRMVRPWPGRGHRAVRRRRADPVRGLPGNPASRRPDQPAALA
jgi:uncharacterized cupin superfamily protein